MAEIRIISSPAVGLASKREHDQRIEKITELLADHILSFFDGRTRMRCSGCNREFVGYDRQPECGECHDLRFINRKYFELTLNCDLNYDRMSYDAYRDMAHWKDVRENVVKHRGSKCEFCNSTTLIRVHHKEYPLKRLEIRSNMLVVVCARCHQNGHGLAPGKTAARMRIDFPPSDQV